MAVPMVDVRVMRVLVGQCLVGKQVAVVLSDNDMGLVRVLVVLVMHMPVRVHQRLMGMRMFMSLDQVQPDPQAHQRAGQPESGRGAFAQHEHRHTCAHERCRRKVSACPRRTQPAQSQYK